MSGGVMREGVMTEGVSEGVYQGEYIKESIHQQDKCLREGVMRVCIRRVCGRSHMKSVEGRT